MPDVKPGESRKDFVSRCVPIVIEEGTAKDGEQAAAVCHSMWEQAQSKAFIERHQGELWLTLDEVEAICPTCAEKMRAKNLSRVNILAVKQMPEQMMEGLCGKFGDDEGFYTRCTEADLPVDDKESFCAWLHHECVGKWPGEKAGARHSVEDRKLVRGIRSRAQEIHDLSVQLEPTDNDEPEAGVMPWKNALKAISRTDDELRVANYLALFGGRDLEGLASPRRNADGSKGEYFTKSTDFESDYTRTGFLYVDWEHGAGEVLDGKGSPGPDDVLGYVDWRTVKIDDKGLWVERVLNRRNKYMRYLEELIEGGLIGNSSQAVTAKVRKKAGGEIEIWPLMRDTLTVSPMEPRMMTENVIAALKALEVPITQVSQSMDAPAPEGVAQDDTDESAQAIQILDIQGGVIMEMTEEKLQELLNEAGRQGAEKALKALPAQQSGVQVTKDAADQPFPAGEYFQAVKTAALYPGTEDPRLRPLKATGLGEETPSTGGYLLSPTVASGILDRMYNVGEILRRVANDPVGPNSNSMVYAALDETSRAAGGSRYGGVLGYWLAEAQTKPASVPAFRQVALKLKKVAALCYATDELLADATALESWLNRTVPEELRFHVEAAIYSGDGAGRPLGIMNSPCLVSVTRIDANEVDATDLGNLWARRWVGSNDYVWLINQAVIPQLVVLTIGNWPVYLPSGSIAGAPSATIFGRPVIEIEYAAALGTTGDIMLASLSQYQTITKGGIQAASSIHVQFATDETAYRFIYRVDGAPMWHSALTPYQGSATQSPFVVLTTASA